MGGSGMCCAPSDGLRLAVRPRPDRASGAFLRMRNAYLYVRNWVCYEHIYVFKVSRSAHLYMSLGQAILERESLGRRLGTLDASAGLAGHQQQATLTP